MTTIETYNDLHPEWNEEQNGEMEEKVTKDTVEIYCITNTKTGKSYIGKAQSYVKNGNQPIRKHGASGRFYKHWKAAHNDENDCPVFYKALGKSKSSNWKIIILSVCSKKHAKEYETKYIKKYDTSNPEKGYNYFVGDNKPNDPQHLEQYQSAKAKSNADRAVGGKLRKNNDSKQLPPNINLRKKMVDGEIIETGYNVQIKLGGTLYSRAFLSEKMTMEKKLELAEKQIEIFKEMARQKVLEAKKIAIEKSTSRYSGSKTNKKVISSKTSGSKSSGSKSSGSKSSGSKSSKTSGKKKAVIEE